MKKIKLGVILHIEKGKIPKSQSKTQIDGYLPYVDIKAFEKGIIENYATTEKTLLCEDGDLLIVCDGSRSGLTGRAVKGVVGSTLSKIYADGLITDFLCYFIQSKYTLLNTQKKGTGTPHLNTEILKEATLIVPHIYEQEKIVARIEELFSKLDKGVEELNKIKGQLKLYRQAVLKEAFEGKNIYGKFDVCEISDIVDDIKIGPFGTMLHKKDYINNGVPVINPQHIKSGEIIHSHNITVSNKKAEELSSYRLQKNDIIMGRRGEMGRVAPITEVENGWICGTGSILFRLKQEYDAVFYSKILASPDSVRYLEENATGTTMKNLNEKIVKHIPVPNITRKQQDDIMIEVDRKLTVCDKIEKTVDKALQKSENLRQSILKQAFEGKLV